jgi:TetR/AcrR family transcriptional regulator, ethionamide resistance regulator
VSTTRRPTPPSARTTQTRRARHESRAQIVAAAAELVRERSFAELTVGAVMDAAGIGRTLFYRYFDDLGDLLARASAEAIEELYATELELKVVRADPAETIRAAIRAAVTVYHRHGPLLRALSEAAHTDPRIAAGQRAFLRRFDELIALRLRELGSDPTEDVEETARALNLLNVNYLLDRFGHGPRVSPGVAAETLTGIWLGAIRAGGDTPAP